MAEETKVEVTPLTPEQQAAKDAAEVSYMTGVMESRTFARANPDFPMNARNAETMFRELKKRSLDWTAENLRTVWKDPNFDRELIDPEDGRPAAKEYVPPAPPAPEVVEPEMFPWGIALEGEEGKQRVANMPTSEFNFYLKNKRTGQIFKQQVEALAITRKDLKEGF